ncbi:MAG: EthD domain-containing protein [Sphingomonadales bacterium]|nr:EthD domain-containing protein [Sphingomonadales bacterium]
MEKIVAALWAPPGESREAYGHRLVSSLPARLAAAGASSIRINIRDEAVSPADALVQQWQAPQQDAVVQFWLPSANALFRAGIDAVLAEASGKMSAWLVCESTIIANTAYPSVPSRRTPGWSQASFISFRPDMTHEAAIAHWHSHHTKVAIDTQSNFEYVQNLIVRPLTEGAPAYDAFVEECFPEAAMSTPEAFFDAVGDPAKFEANVAAMTESCAGFIDFSRIDIIPSSQYDFAAHG